MAEAPRFRAALGSYPHTRAIKSGALSSPDVAFDFVEVDRRGESSDYATCAARQSLNSWATVVTVG